MFGLFKKSPTPPVTISADIEINASVEDVFSSVELSNPNSYHAAAGLNIEPAENTTNMFLGKHDDLPGVQFRFRETANEPHYRYVIESDFGEDQSFGALISDTSEFRLVSMGGNRCRVELILEARLRDGIRGRRLQHEQDVLMLSVHNDLSRLKAMAEDGIEAAQSAGFEDQFQVEDQSCIELHVSKIA